MKVSHITFARSQGVLSRQAKGTRRRSIRLSEDQSEWALPVFDQAVLGVLLDPDNAEFTDSILHHWADCSATQAASLFDQAVDSLDSDSESIAR